MAADYNEAQGLDVRLTWPEDTAGDGAALTEPGPPGVASARLRSKRGGDSRGDAEISRQADALAAWLPVVDARLGELIARVGRLEASGHSPTDLEVRLAELVDRIALLERGIEDRLGHLDDRLEYLARAGMVPTAADADGNELRSGLTELSEQLDSLTNEMTALRRRIPLRGRGEPTSGQPSVEELAAAIADRVVTSLAGRPESAVSADSATSGPGAPEGRRRRR